MAKKKVLIVEDEAIAALGLEALVEGWGYEICESASSGEDAVEKAGACSPDIILLDVNLGGGMDGIEAAGIICSKKMVPVIFISGYSAEITKKRAGFFNAVDYIEKPIDFDELQKKLHDLLNPAPRK
ncbi:MAG: response regulator [Nitrospiraceae bacterium]|nr:response regulator [Nitrospiraceae bacterium]